MLREQLTEKILDIKRAIMPAIARQPTGVRED
jgi:hypothetical protein